MLARRLCSMGRQNLLCVPPGLGAEQMLLLVGVFYCEATRADNDPVAVSIYQSLVAYPDRRPSSAPFTVQNSQDQL